MIQAPANKIIVYPKAKYTKNITDIMKRAAIQNGATVDPSEVVNIVGEVVSVPLQISDTRDYEGFSLNNIKVGDTAIFSYKVIYDLFMKTEHQEPIYRNRIWYEGKELFTCDIRNLFGIIREGEITMVNGYVMLTEYEKKHIIVPAGMKKQKNATSSQIMHIGDAKTSLTPINAKQGDTVFYNSSKAAHYHINDKKFVILQQDRILGMDNV
jgi:co-chaperonin GroES (HSP10)